MPYVIKVKFIKVCGSAADHILGVFDLWASAQAGPLVQYIWHSTSQATFTEANRSTKVILY